MALTLEQRLRDRLSPWLGADAWVVGFSGGLDSSVLLHVLWRLGQQGFVPPLSAVYIHHGLQKVADAWPECCRAFCERLGIPLRVIPVRVDRSCASLELAAREARYAAFAQCLQPGQVLLMAQHADDQAETLLFRLLRGSGVLGLGGMAEQRSLGSGVLVRPLLPVARAELEAYAQLHGLGVVEDPSNANLSFARNYLRHRVLPSMRERWPSVVANLGRTAEHLRDSQGLLDDLAREDLEGAEQSDAMLPWLYLPSIRVHRLLALSPVRRRNALRYWLRSLTLLPDSRHWAGLEDVLGAREDACPVWRLAGGQLCRALGSLWWVPEYLSRPLEGAWSVPIKKLGAMDLPANGRVLIQGVEGEYRLSLSYRQGGERLVLPGRGRRALKALLNELHVPVFLRQRLPLLWRDGELVAIANYPQLHSVGLDTKVVFEWAPPCAFYLQNGLWHLRSDPV